MGSHIDVDGDCPLAVVPCKYCDIGCKLKVLGLRPGLYACYERIELII